MIQGDKDVLQPSTVKDRKPAWEGKQDETQSVRINPSKTKPDNK